MKEEIRQAIIFDVDDTLYNLMDSFEKTHKELFDELKNVSCEQLFEASRKYNKIAFDLWNQGKLTKKEEFDYRIFHSYAQYGKTLTVEELNAFQHKYRFYQNNIQMTSGMDSILTMLSNSGAVLGILTNGNAKDQQKKIDALRVNKWIPQENVFISENLPMPKPDVAAFEYVENTLRLEKENIWYVGDTYNIDIVGADNSGWHTIWFNHRHRDCIGEENLSEHEVYDIQELYNVLSSIVTL